MWAALYIALYDMRIRNRAFFSFTRVPKSRGPSVKVSEIRRMCPGGEGGAESKVSEIRHECVREGGGGPSRKYRRILTVFTVCT